MLFFIDIKGEHQVIRGFSGVECSSTRTSSMLAVQVLFGSLGRISQNSPLGQPHPPYKPRGGGLGYN